MNFGDKVYQCQGRDIIKVEIAENVFQPFYRSTGKNSHKAGEWLPCDGIVWVYDITVNSANLEDNIEVPVWINKSKYANKENEELHRYGTPELKAISEQLGKLDIPSGEETAPSIINTYLGYAN
jgi:hypothetical protein